MTSRPRSLHRNKYNGIMEAPFHDPAHWTKHPFREMNAVPAADSGWHPWGDVMRIGLTVDSARDLPRTCLDRKKALALPILTKIDDTVFSDGPSVFGRTSRAQVLNPASRVRAIVGYVPPAVRKGAISLHRSPGTVLRLTRGLYAHWNHGCLGLRSATRVAR